MIQRILSDEEYKACFYDICNTLPERLVGTGCLWTKNGFISIEIIHADELLETVNIRATFTPDGYVMWTTNPILKIDAAIAHQILAFGVTDISGIRWL